MPESVLDIMIRTRKKGSAAKEAAADIAQLKKGIGGAIEGMTGLSLSSIGVAGAIAGVGSFMRSAVVDTAAYGREVANTARTTGMSAEEASKFLQIADDLKIETNTLKTAFRELNNAGIQPNLENIKGLAVEYQGLKTPVEKAQFAMEKFGKRAGPEMQKLLEQTPGQIDAMAEAAERAGLVMNQEGVDAARAYDEAIDNLTDKWEGFKLKVGNEILPVIVEVTDYLDLQAEAARQVDEALRGEPMTQALLQQRQEMIRQLTEQLQNEQIQADLAAQRWGAMAKAFGQTTGVDDAAGAFEDLNGELIKTSDYFKDITAEMLFNKAAAGLSEEASLTLARSMGLVNESSYNALTYLEDLRLQLEEGTITQGEYNRKVSDMNLALKEADGKHVVATVDYIENHYINRFEGGGGAAQSSGAGGGRGRHGGEAYASGTDGWREVGPGYPNDSLPIWLSSGEKFAVVPKGGSMPVSGGVTIMPGAIQVNGAGSPSAVVDELLRRVNEIARNAALGGSQYIGR